MSVSPLGISEFSERADVAVSAVIVNWNTSDLLDECLRSLRAHGPHALEIVVVDNGSNDNSLAMLEQRWPDAHVIANAENRGYQAANNQGMRGGARRAVAAHQRRRHADARMPSGASRALRNGRQGRNRRPAPRVWRRLLPALDRGAAAVVAGRNVILLLRRPAGPALGVVAGARRSRGVPTGLGFQRLHAGSANRARRCRPHGRAVLRGTWTTSICARAGDAGWTVWYEPAATAIHLMGQSTKRQTGAASPMALASFVRWYGMHRSRASFAAFRAITATGFALRAALYTIASLGGRRRRPAARADTSRTPGALSRGPTRERRDEHSEPALASTTA